MAQRKNCLECDKIFETKDKRQKFCSLSCANKKNNRGRKRNKTTKDKISVSLREYYSKEENLDAQRKRNQKRDLDREKTNKRTILNISSRTTQKILRRMNLPCSRCGWNKAPGDAHHIYGRKIQNSDAHTNLSYLCPNCHREAHSGLISPEDLINLESYIGKRWKEYYYN